MYVAVCFFPESALPVKVKSRLWRRICRIRSPRALPTRIKFHNRFRRAGPSPLRGARFVLAIPDFRAKFRGDPRGFWLFDFWKTDSDVSGRQLVLLVSSSARRKIGKIVGKMRNNGTTLTIAGKPPFSDIRRSGFYGGANSISLSRAYSEVPRLRQLSVPAPNHRPGRTLR